MRLIERLTCGLVLMAALPVCLSAQGGAIRDLPGFRTTAVSRGDSESSATNLGFTINFQGRTRVGVYVNTNGSLTFDQPLENYAPDALRRLSREILAAFLADVDTRAPGSGTISYGNDTVNGRRAFGAIYQNVGYFDTKADKLNRFQILVIDRSDTGAGNFDAEYNYEAITWEAGDNQGRGGYGAGARAGFAGPLGTPGTFYEIPGSGLSGTFLDGVTGLSRRSYGSDVPGRFVFQFREGRVRQDFTPTPSTVNFTWQVGTPAPVNQTIVVNSALPGVRFEVAANLTTGGNWLNILNPTLVTPANLSLSLNTAVATPGNYVGNITLTPDPDSGLAAQTVRVNLTVTGMVSITPPSNCTYRFNPGSVTLSGAATSVSIDVRTQNGCTWLATSPVNWITFRVPNGTGDGQLLFTTAQNGGTARSAVLTVGGQAVTVIQAPFIPGSSFLATCRIGTFAGTGVPSFSQDNVIATSAAINAPQHIFTDRFNSLYVVDNGNLRVRKITDAGVITTVAGTGFDGFTGDGGPAINAAMVPSAGAVDPQGNLYVADGKYHTIRRVGNDGVITRVAGTLEQGSLGSGVAGLSAQFNGITGMATDRNGNLYIADSGNQVVRRLDSQGVINLFAGSGQPGNTGDGEQAILARLGSPRKVAVDALGNVYVAEPDNHRVRRINPQGIIQPFAGTGQRGNGADLGLAIFTTLNTPSDVAVDNQGNVYIADTGNNRIRRVNPQGIIEPVAGRGNAGFNGDGGLANDALLNNPQSVAADVIGNVYIADTNNNRIRRVQCEYQNLGIGPRLTSVVNAANFQPVIAPNSFVTITGETLSSQTLTWDSAIGSDGRLPTELGGVRVRVNGKPAYIYYVSPTQVNILTPAETAVGALPVEITAASGVNILPVEHRASAPAFFSQIRGGKTWPVALFANENTLVAEPGSIPGSNTRSARAGDYLVLYATGLGATSPDAPAGQVLRTTYQLANSAFKVTVGGVQAPVQFVGLTFAGVYQLNIQIPAGVAPGDAAVVMDLGNGVTSPENAVVPVVR